jgi:hypothetical protein
MKITTGTMGKRDFRNFIGSPKTGDVAPVKSMNYYLGLHEHLFYFILVFRGVAFRDRLLWMLSDIPSITCLGLPLTLHQKPPIQAFKITMAPAPSLSH